GFGAGGAHGALHEPSHGLDDLLHDAEVIEHGEERADEDDGGQDGEGEDGERRGGVAEFAEDHGGAVGGVAKELRDGPGAGGEDALAEIDLEDDVGEEELQAESPADRAPADGAAVGRKRVSDDEEDQQSEQTGVTTQSELSFTDERWSG